RHANRLLSLLLQRFHNTQSLHSLPTRRSSDLETRLEHASAAPEETRNFHTARLNLESVYGGGPKRSPELYDLSKNGCETFPPGRSEEHTSELQSRFDLVCRLLLEKKKHRKKIM